MFWDVNMLCSANWNQNWNKHDSCLDLFHDTHVLVVHMVSIICITTNNNSNGICLTFQSNRWVLPSKDTRNMAKHCSLCLGTSFLMKSSWRCLNSSHHEQTLTVNIKCLNTSTSQTFQRSHLISSLTHSQNCKVHGSSYHSAEQILDTSLALKSSLFNTSFPWLSDRMKSVCWAENIEFYKIPNHSLLNFKHNSEPHNERNSNIHTL